MAISAAALLPTIVVALSFVPAAAWAGDILCQPGLAAYQSALYPVQRQYCAGCHGDGGIAAGHSVSDPEKAYAVTRGLVDFGAIGASTFMTKFKAKHWLQYPGSAAIPVQDDQIETLIQEWWDQGERSCPSATPWVTAADPIPASLPARASGGFITLAWDLASLRPELAGCSFQIDIQRFTDPQPDIPGSYRVKNPRAGCVGKTLRLAGIGLPVSRRVEGYENYYEGVDLKIPPIAAPDALVPLSSEEGILVERVASGDSLSVAFEKIEVIP